MPGTRTKERLRTALPSPMRDRVDIAVRLTYELLLPIEQPHARLRQSRLRACQSIFSSIIAEDPAMKGKTPRACDAVLEALFNTFPAMETVLKDDVAAALRGDPAALSAHYVIASYPALLAICTYRVAHEVLGLGLPTLARQLTEVAHSRTGIDIHPGATIAPGFFIDHGTGVVIGETTEIGPNVRLYQGVTLGAGTDPTKAGRTKRHPTLESDVICFANSSILGPVRIGSGSRIGANATVFEDVPRETLVLMPRPELIRKTRRTTDTHHAERHR